jgi:amidase
MTLWGPLSRRVADSVLVYDAIKDGAPSFAAAVAGDPGRLRVAMSVRTPPLTGLQADAEQLGAVERVAQALRDLGHEVVEREVEYTPALVSNVLARYVGGIAAMGRSVPHPERLSRRTRGYMRIGAAVPGVAIRRAKAAAAADGEALWRGLGDGVDLLLTPMFTRRPPRVREYEGTSALRSLTGSVRLVPYCGAYNHTGQPAASVPAGFTSDGFPLAVQLVAPAHSESVLLQVAAQLEGAIGWADRRPEL